jgi:hypothetical protein
MGQLMEQSFERQKSMLFTLRSDQESICMICYATIRVAYGETMLSAQQRHTAECSGRVGGN